MELQVTPVEREARRLGLPVLTPKTLKDRRGASRIPRASGRRGGGGGLWPDPAETDSRCATARLLQRACLAAAALARRRADQPRHHGGRRRERRHHHADGRRSRHRRHGDGGARTDSTRHDGGRPARRAGAARRRSDAARAGRRRARLARAHAAAASGRHLCRQDFQGRNPHRLDQAVRAKCTTTSAACRRFPAPGSSSAACASRRCARPEARGAARPARRSTTV